MIICRQKEQEQNNLIEEDNQYLVSEMMKNSLIKEEFESIRSQFGEEAYQLNKMKLLQFIKQGKLNLTYSVKYYGVDEGQIGILSRKVPFEEFQYIEKQYKLPRVQSQAAFKKHIAKSKVT